MKIAWTKLALQDLDHAWSYIAADKPEAADATIERIAKTVDELLSYQNMGRPGRVRGTPRTLNFRRSGQSLPSKIQGRGTRELVVIGTPFVVPYRIKRNQIEILAVIHGARRWPDAL